MLAQSRRHAPPSSFDGLEYLVDDCESLANVRGPFDMICNFENIEHLRKPEAFLAAASRLLSSDGVMFCSWPERSTTTWIDGRPQRTRTTPRNGIATSSATSSPSPSREVEMLVQVEGLWALKRRKARENLNKHLTYLWRSPAVHLGPVPGATRRAAAAMALGRLPGGHIPLRLPYRPRGPGGYHWR